MGTRHLTCVVVDKQMKVAQYGQWDGYLEGQGQTIVDFISGLTKADLVKFRKHVRGCTWVDDVEVQRAIKSVGSKDGWMTLDQSQKWTEKYPQWSRDTGAGVLGLILTQGSMGLQDNSSFAADSLFCEWAYVVDLDAEVLEVYKGFQTEKHSKGRFHKLPSEQQRRGENQYYPVKLIKKLPFRNLAKAFKTFREAQEAAAEADE
jgi:hypothetical protein